MGRQKFLVWYIQYNLPTLSFVSQLESLFCLKCQFLNCFYFLIHIITSWVDNAAAVVCKLKHNSQIPLFRKITPKQ